MKKAYAYTRPRAPRRGSPRQGTVWTRSEIAYLTWGWSHKTRRSIRQHLGRRWQAIALKAHALGLRFGPPADTESIQEAAARHHMTPYRMVGALKLCGVPIQRAYGWKNNVATKMQNRYVDPGAVDAAVERFQRMETLTKWLRRQNLGGTTFRKIAEHAGLELPKGGIGGRTSPTYIDPTIWDPVVAAYRLTPEGAKGLLLAESLRLHGR